MSLDGGSHLSDERQAGDTATASEATRTGGDAAAGDNDEATAGKQPVVVANVVVGGASQGPVYAADGTLLRPGTKDD